MIQHLTELPGDREAALVINGDFIDFLAEPGATYFDPLGATDKLDRLFRERAFSAVWKSLREFVSKPQRILAIVLGNHDLELALPRVRRHLT